MEELRQLILTVKSNSISSTLYLLTKCVQKKENEKIIMSTVNSLLSNTKTRTFGLELLNSLIPQLSEEVLTENAFHWLNYCGVHRNQDVSALKLEVLEKIIETIGKSERFSKKFTSEYLLNTVKFCLSYQKAIQVNGTLKCLYQCMKYYPSWFVNYREETELFLMKFIEDVSGDHTEEAAVAFHYYLQTGGPGQEGVNYINNFRNGFRKLCNTVLYMYDFYPKYFGDSGNNGDEVFALTTMSPDSENFKDWEVVAGRIVNCLVFIKTLIEKKFPVEKQIIPNQIISIIIRGFKQHCCVLEDDTGLLQRQSILLSEIQTKLFHILQVFLIGNTTGFLPFTYVTIKSLFITLEKCRDCTYCSNNLHYREQLYKTITTLLQLGNAVNHQHFQEVLISFLLKDIDLDKHEINVLNLNKTEKKTESLQNPSSGTGIIQRKICSFALNVLRCLLEMYPLKISLTQWKNLIFSIIQHLKHVSHSNDARTVNLYQILALLLKQEYTKYTPTIHSMISILNKGLYSGDHRIITAAREGLDVIELLSQPISSSLFISHVDQNDLKKVDDEREVVYNSSDEITNCVDVSKEINVTKEIHILSDIIITQSKEPARQVIDVEGDIEKEVISTDIGTDSSNDISVNVSQPSFIEEEITLPQNDVVNVQPYNEDLKESEVKQPPQKKMRSDNQGLNSMISSFQDEVNSVAEHIFS